MYDKPLQTYQTRQAPGQASTWVLVLVTGIAAIGLGLLFLAAPGSTVKVVAKFLGLFFLIGGISAICSIALNSEHWGWKLIAGLAGVIGGMIVMEHPLWSTLLVDTVLVLALAVIGIVMGGAHLIQAFRGGGWGAGILGVIYLVLGLILLFSPLIGAVALPLVLAIFGIIGGIVAIYIAFRMRRADRESTEGTV